MSKSERFLAIWPDVNVFIARNWVNFVEPARTLLASMLGQPGVPETQKQAIHKALIEDNQRAMRAKPLPAPAFNLNPNHPGAIERKIFHNRD